MFNISLTHLGDMHQSILMNPDIHKCPEINDIADSSLKGTVRNVIDFGAFVDIGVHQDGLVHISEMSERYIKHPLEAVSVGDVVDVRVLGVDMKKKRISLSMKGIK